MIIDDLRAVGVEFGLVYNELTNILQGSISGYSISIRVNEKDNCYVFNAWVKANGFEGDEQLKNWMEQYKQKLGAEDFIRAYNYAKNTFIAVLFSVSDSNVNKANISQFIKQFVGFLSVNYYSNCCADCGTGFGIKMYQNGVITAQLCDNCRNARGEAAANVAKTEPAQAPAPQPIPVAAQMNTGYVAPMQNMPNVQSVPQPVDSMGYVSAENIAPSTGYAEPEPIAQTMNTNYAMPPQPMNMNIDYQASVSNINGVNSQPVQPYIHSQEINPIIEQAHSNPVLGFIGALLFSLIGCAVWIIIDQMGYVSWLGGLLIGFLTMTGYLKFGKRLDVFGVIICVLILLAEIYLCDRVSVAITVMNTWNESGGDVSFLDAYNSFDLLMENADVSGAFYETLIWGYVMTFASFIVMLVSNRKKR